MTCSSPPRRAGPPAGSARRGGGPSPPAAAARGRRPGAGHALLVTGEGGVLAGGFGSAVWETLADGGGPVPRILRVGLPDRFVTPGAPGRLPGGGGPPGA